MLASWQVYFDPRKNPDQWLPFELRLNPIESSINLSNITFWIKYTSDQYLTFEWSFLFDHCLTFVSNKKISTNYFLSQV